MIHLKHKDDEIDVQISLEYHAKSVFFNNASDLYLKNIWDCSLRTLHIHDPCVTELY